MLADDFDVSADEFYDGMMLNDQWDGQTREAREDRLIQDIRYANRLDRAEVDDEDDPRWLHLYASVKAKALVFAMGVDAAYDTDYSVRLAQDPLQFGVPQIDQH